MKRRDVLRGLALGAAGGLLGPSVVRWVREARGASDVNGRVNLFVLTDGNGWTHQAGGGRNSPTLDTEVRSVDDWDLPSVLAPLEGARERVSIVRPLYNPHNGSLHGNGWATLSVVRGVDNLPGGISLDRLVARERGSADPFSSLALGVALRGDRPPVSCSAEGPRTPFPAIGDPHEAYRRVFGSASGRDASDALARDASLLDGVVEDLGRVRDGLAGPERAKLEQLTESFRSMEQQLSARRALLDEREPPSAPGSPYELGLREDVIRSHVDILAQAMSFGLTRVGHLSILGFNAHNAGWGFLGYGGDGHEDLAHVGRGYSAERATEAYHSVISFKAREFYRLYDMLNAVSAGDGTLADQSLFVWVNSGGGKHHDGCAWHPVVMLGNAGGRIRSGQYMELPFRQHSISEVFLAVARACGVDIETFGDPEHCPGPLPGLLA